LLQPSHLNSSLNFWRKRLMKRTWVFIVAASIVVISQVGRSDAVTADIAAATANPATALVGDVVTFTSTNPCTITCALTWRRPDLGIPRFGGAIVGRGEQISLTFAEPGTYHVVLDLEEICVGTTRLACHSTADVVVNVVVAIDPVATTTTGLTQATTTTVGPATTTTTSTMTPTPTPTPTTTTTTTTAPEETTVPSTTMPATATITTTIVLPSAEVDIDDAANEEFEDDGPINERGSSNQGSKDRSGTEWPGFDMGD
jgi:hypothetical protein